jgi:hypothetical protein
MQRKDLQVGDIVAVFNYRYGSAVPDCHPVKISSIEKPFEEDIHGGPVRLRYRAVKKTGIDGVLLTDDLQETDRTYEKNLKAAKIFSKWEDYLIAHQAQEESKAAEQKRKAEHIERIAVAWQRIEVLVEKEVLDRLVWSSRRDWDVELGLKALGLLEIVQAAYENGYRDGATARRNRTDKED